MTRRANVVEFYLALQAALGCGHLTMWFEGGWRFRWEIRAGDKHLRADYAINPIDIESQVEPSDLAKRLASDWRRSVAKSGFDAPSPEGDPVQALIQWHIRVAERNNAPCAEKVIATLRHIANALQP